MGIDGFADTGPKSCMNCGKQSGFGYFWEVKCGVSAEQRKCVSMKILVEVNNTGGLGGRRKGADEA